MTLHEAVEELRQSSGKVFCICDVVDQRVGCGLEIEDEDEGDAGSECLATVQATWDEKLRGIPCRACNSIEDEASMVVCDCCEGCWHPRCGDDEGRNPVHDGPWYCTTCRGYIATHGYADVIQDLGLIDYLWRGILPDQDEEAARVLRVAAKYRANKHELETQVRPYGTQRLARWVPVPPVPMRQQLLRDTHEALGHAGRDRLTEAMLTEWWWEKIREDAAATVRSCPACAKDAIPLQPSTTQPALTARPDGPFRGWSIDLAGPYPPDEEGHRWLAVAVDVYSKWVEAQPLKSKHAFVTASWFY